MRGQFITVEGVEGSGKSTNLKFIHDYLISRNIPVVSTREPGGTVYAESIRDLLLRHESEPLNNDAELLLVFAARAQHLSQKIIPAIRQGDWILCDRFTDATYAYQGGGRQMGMALIETLEQAVQGDLRPDLTLYLDISVEAGMQRAEQRGELDRFESEKLDFFERVRQTYLQRARQYPDIYRVIDASLPLVEVQVQIKEAMDQFCHSRNTPDA